MTETNLDAPKAPEDKPVMSSPFETLGSKHAEAKPDESKKAEPVPDKPDGPKEHYAAIRFLIGQLRNTKDENVKVTLDKISERLDLIEGKPAAVEADKHKQLQAKEAEIVEKIRADREKAEEKAA